MNNDAISFHIMNYTNVKGDFKLTCNNTSDRDVFILNDSSCRKSDGSCECREILRVGMAYVPMQPWETPYTPDRGLRRGTIFPCLDLPFKGGVRR